MKRIFITALLFTALTTTWAQNATNKPIGLFKITNITSDSIEIDLSTAALDQYQLCGDSIWLQMAIGANGIFAIEPTEPLPTGNIAEKGEYDDRISDYNGAEYKKWKYNTDTSSQIFPMNSWIIETWKQNKASNNGYDIIKCITAKRDTENQLQGVWIYSNENNETYYRIYSKNSYVTLSLTDGDNKQNKYIGELTKIIETKKVNYYRTEKDRKVHRAIFIDENTMRLTCTTDEQYDTTEWKRCALPPMIEDVAKYIDCELLTDANGTLWENSNIIQPEFSGGNEALKRYLSRNIKYPAESRKRNSEGRTFVNFIINTDGSISEIKTIKSSGDKLLDQEAERVVSFMPKWKPALKNNAPVSVRFTIPIIFKLK